MKIEEVKKKDKLKIAAKFAIVFLLTVILAFVGLDVAQSKSTPKFMGYEGQLTDSNDNRQDGSFDMTFRIYDAKSGGNKLWEETHTGVNVTDGYFAVTLGTNTPIDLEFDQRYWISLEVDSDGEMNPRQPINTVGYSFTSDITYGTFATSSAPTPTSSGKLYFNTSTNKLYVDDGNQWNELADLSDGQTFTGTTTFTASTTLNTTTINQQLDVDSSTLFVDSANDRVGINSSSPITDLSVEGQGFFSATTTASDLVASNSITINGDTRTAWPSGQSSIWSTSTGRIFAQDTSKSFLVGSQTTSTNNSIFEVNGSGYFSDNFRVGTSTEQITTSTFSLDGDDAYIHDLLGVGDELFVENQINVGTSSLHLSGDTSGGEVRMDNGPLTIDSTGSLSLNTNNNQDIITGSGNFGVNTTSPSEQLVVDGNTSISGAATTTDLVVNNNASFNGSTNGISLKDLSNTSSVAFTDRSNTFQNSNTFSATTTLATNSGRVGIGITNPSETLHIGSGGGIQVDSQGYDISQATFNDSKDVNSETNLPSGMRFNNDGSKLYVVDYDTSAIYEYGVSPKYDISQASLNDSLSVSSQGTTPRGMAFNDDGSKLYVIDQNNQKIYEYDLGNNKYDVSEATLNDSLDVSNQDNTPYSVGFNNDGSKLYITGDENDNVYEYDLSNNKYDISEAQFTDSLDVSTESTQPEGVEFNSDGSKLYVVGKGTSKISEYDLDTPYDISTGSGNYVDSLDVSSQDGRPRGMAFNADGSNLYFVGSINHKVYEYSVPLKGGGLTLGGSADISGTATTSDFIAQNSITLNGDKRTSWSDIVNSFGGWATSTGKIYPTNTSSAVLVGTDTTSTNNSILEVSGDGYLSGKLGIGTSSPSTALDVAGEAHFTTGTLEAYTDSNGNVGLDVNGTPGNREGSRLYIDNANNTNEWGLVIDSNGAGGDIGWQIDNGSNNKVSLGISGGDWEMLSTNKGLLHNQLGNTTNGRWAHKFTNNNNYVTLELEGSSGQTEDVFAVNSHGATTGDLFRVEADGSLANSTTFFTDTSNDRVGIGTASPDAALDVKGNIDLDDGNVVVDSVGGRLSLSAATDIKLIPGQEIKINDDTPIRWGVSGDYDMLYDSSDTGFEFNEGNTDNTIWSVDDSTFNMGINTTSADTALEVNGTSTLAGRVAINSSSPTFPSSTKLSVDGSIAATIPGAGTSNNLCFSNDGVIGQCNSSKVYKEDINALDLGHDTLLQLEPKSFTWKTTGRKSLGFLAEGTKQVDERLVTYDNDGNIAGVRYGEITALLTQAIQERNQILKTNGAPTSSPALVVNSTGDIGIGTSTPKSKLTVNGKINASNLRGGPTSLSVDNKGNIIRTPSDQNLKEDIKPISGALQKVTGLQGVRYNWKDENRFGSGEEIGFVAQDVGKIVPQAVQKGGKYMSLNYGNLTAMLVEAVKEQQKQIQGLAAGNNIQGSSANLNTDELTVASSTELGEITVKEHATFGEDTVGQAVVKKGYKDVTVRFKDKYKSQPIVTANQIGEPVDGLNYSVNDISTAKFKIVLDQRYEQDIKFSWHAFAAGEDSKISFSDGTTSTIEVNVEEIKGCTNPDAENYDPDATANDSSCKIGGCIDVLAENYDPDATYGDGSCTYSENSSSDSDTEDTSSTSTQDTSTTTENTTTTTETSTTTESVSSTTDTSTTTDSTSTQTDTNSTTTKTSTSTTETTTTTTTKTSDETAPKITMNGSTPVTLYVGDSYDDAGATAEDNKDGGLTDKIKTTNNVDTSTSGTYEVIYNVSDTAGNSAEKRRTVEVKEQESSTSSTQSVVEPNNTDETATTTDKTSTSTAS